MVTIEIIVVQILFRFRCKCSAVSVSLFSNRLILGLFNMSITKDYIRGLLGDLENDSVERTISTTNTDKFGQAICAFANDLPCNNLSLIHI